MNASPLPDPASRRPADWPPLDHGMIGNGRVLALVAPDSGIEWLCLPRFDSPSIFGALLDARKGGVFRVRPEQGALLGRMSYLANTNVLVTRFETGDARWEVVDFAPRLPHGWGVKLPREIIRIVRPISGNPTLRVDFDPRPDYARRPPEIVETTGGLLVRTGNGDVHLTTSLPVPYLLSAHPFVLTRPLFFVLSHGGPSEISDLHGAEHSHQLTAQGWRVWARTCALPEFAADAVLRSALALKLHIYHDTGAVIAAATTSVPEAMGTERTWDYRYCWLRDAAFVVEALRRLSHNSEGIAFVTFLRDVAESGPLQPVYGVDGARNLPEEKLTHLAGFGGNGHVRIGNAAALQKQNDLTGEILLCLETLLHDPRTAATGPEGLLPLVERLVGKAIADADTPDTGIWEFRSLLRPYTFSRALCWAAIHRGSNLAELLGAPALAEQWREIAAREQEIVLRRGFSTELGFFTQTLDGRFPDASNLLLPAVGLIDAHDPRFVSTLHAYERLLVENGWMLRYRNRDDFGETTSAFTICSFWRAEALALTGALDEARELFERLVAFANPVGLFSEDIDPASGAQLGNFPQAYTHVGLIHAAITIGTLLDARAGRVRAWV